nr:hypothetical protein [Paenibacillus agricola]
MERWQHHLYVDEDGELLMEMRTILLIHVPWNLRKVTLSSVQL